MKKEFEKKLRGTDYYIAVAKKVMEKKAVSKKELVIICDQVDKEQGYRKRDARAIDFSIDTLASTSLKRFFFFFLN